ncbi:uncharacterized protein BXIN_2815 [Babesia sp. Xinjiang]|uniref:uncharacterized protein n=1 Tax=Babesia sp. Xinjiang TaxID=462227 RepID=UPI000A252EA0|nr:uncharacterized protein BXIN_2815 [Babesia sp. Xinjiang]ORM41754.1 hypothetical protein BXIN_2815 [Babesia sp. Xinjiang]
MRLWLLLLHILVSLVDAFLVHDGGLRLTSGVSRPSWPVLRGKSLLDDPLLLAPSSKPGEDHEVVVSESPAFGLQRTLYTHRRKARARGPLFNPGDCVYLASGPYRNARGTVLSTFRRAPGEPHLVSVVLDCRNERGIVRGRLNGYHGFRLTVRESQLTARPPFSPFSPPPLSSDEYRGLSRTKSGHIRRSQEDSFIALLMSRVVNSVHISDFQYAFDSLCRLNVDKEYPYQSLVVQIARNFSFQEEGGDLRNLVNSILGRLRHVMKAECSGISRGTIPWFSWAVGMLRSRRLINDEETCDIIVKRISNLLLSGKLDALTQGEISLLAMGFYNCGPLRHEVLHRLAMLFSYFPVKTVESRRASVLARSLTNAGIVHPAFSRLICDMIRGEHDLLPPESAVHLLEYLSTDPSTPQTIKDELLACCSVPEFLKPTATPEGPAYELAVRLAGLSDREMSELLHAIRSGECELPLKVAVNSLRILPVVPSSLELIRLMLVRTSKIYDRLTLKQRLRVLHAAIRVNKCPIEVVDAVEHHLKSMEPDRVLEPSMAKVLGQFLPRIPDSRSSAQRVILDHLERFITFSLSSLREKALDAARARSVMRTATLCLERIPTLGYEMSVFAQHSATLLREGIKFAPHRMSILLGLMAVQAMSPKYFDAASESARQLLADPSVVIPSEVLPLVELLLAVKSTTEGEDSCSSLSGHVNIPLLPVPKDIASKPRRHRDVHDFSVLFSLMVRSRLLDKRGNLLSNAFVFAEDNINSLSSVDLLLLRDALVSLDAFDEKWEGLFALVPKGIDAVT